MLLRTGVSRLMSIDAAIAVLDDLLSDRHGPSADQHVVVVVVVVGSTALQGTMSYLDCREPNFPRP